MAQRIPREQNYKVQLLNVKLLSNERHGDVAYKNIMSEIFRNRIKIPVYGDANMIFKTQFEDVVNVDGLERAILYGKISRFTLIDGNDWLNLDNMEVENIELPINTFPSYKESEYIFIPEAHRLAIVNKDGFSVSLVEKFLKGAIKNVINTDEDYEVYIEQSEDVFSRIMTADQILKLQIDISYSNNDIGDDSYEFMDSQLRIGEVGRMKLDVSPNHNNNINTDVKIIDGALKVAQSNGFVKATIMENGKKIKVETKEHPKTITLKCIETMLRQNIVQTVIRLFRNNNG
jgi:hypothetical protein